MAKWVTSVTHFLAVRKGLLPLVACLLVIANFALRMAAPATWLSASDLLLHIGILTAIVGFLLARAL